MAEMHISFDNNLSSSLRPTKGKSLLEVPTDYIVIAIKTTGFDSRFDEVIEVAAATVSNGSVIDTYQSFIKPENPISEFITDLTGITHEMVANAPPVSVVLPQFLAYVGSSLIVGHSINFHINFIYDYCCSLGLQPLENNFIDTLIISRKINNDYKNHKLSTLSTNLAVTVTETYRALSDVLTVYQCYEKMKTRILAENLSLSRTRYTNLSKSIHAQTDSFNEDSPVFGRVFAFTGALEKMSRKEAMQLVVNAGGICGDGVTAETNFLVLGNNDYCKAIKDGKSIKQKKAEKLQLNGQDIATISEGVFYDMLEA